MIGTHENSQAVVCNVLYLHDPSHAGSAALTAEETAENKLITAWQSHAVTAALATEKTQAPEPLALPFPAGKLPVEDTLANNLLLAPLPETTPGVS